MQRAIEALPATLQDVLILRDVEGMEAKEVCELLKITAEWAGLLDGECRVLLQEKKAVYLDCSHVDFIDARGIEILNGLPPTHVTLMSAPGYVAELLQIGGRL